MERIDVEAKLGTTEIWQVLSVRMAHPFHIHGALFRVLSIAGAHQVIQFICAGAVGRDACNGYALDALIGPGA